MCRRLASSEKLVASLPDECAGGWRAAYNQSFIGRSADLRAVTPYKNLWSEIMSQMTKTQACRIIHNCAIAYRDNLANRNVLFIAERDGRHDYFEALFLTSNYQHLTGAGTKTAMTANAFFNRATDNRITENELMFSEDGTTRMKLEVLPTLMKIHYIARMVGNYDKSGNLLMADKIAGTTTAAMGFVKDGQYYYPNSALKTDVKAISEKPFLKVSAVFIKDIGEERYSNITFTAKGMNIYDIARRSGVCDIVTIPPLPDN